MGRDDCTGTWWIISWASAPLMSWRSLCAAALLFHSLNITLHITESKTHCLSPDSPLPKRLIVTGSLFSFHIGLGQILPNSCGFGDMVLFLSFFFLRKILFNFRERGERKEKKQERNTNVWLPLVHPLLGTWPITHTCALTGNWTGDPLVHKPALNPLSHTSQGWNGS